MKQESDGYYHIVWLRTNCKSWVHRGWTKKMLSAAMDQILFGQDVAGTVATVKQCDGVETVKHFCYLGGKVKWRFRRSCDGQKMIGLNLENGVKSFLANVSH